VWRQLHLLEVDRRNLAFPTALDVVAELLPLVQVADARALDDGYADERVWRSSFLRLPKAASEALVCG
jgi:hypothetical protein